MLLRDDKPDRSSAPAGLLLQAPELEALRAANHRAGSFFMHMLQDDFQNNGYRYTWNLDLKPSQKGDARVPDESLATLLGDFSYYGRDSTGRLVARYISSVGLDLLTSGMSVFELFWPTTPGLSGSAQTPCLGVLPSWSLRSRRRRIEQCRGESGVVRWVPLPPSRLRRVAVEGRWLKDIRRGVEALRQRDRGSIGGRRSDLVENPPVGYDLARYEKSVDLPTARATRHLGWGGRGDYLRRASGAYIRFRELRFQVVWLRIAEAALATLNSVTSDPDVFGEHIFSVRVPTLPQPAQVEVLIDQLVSGEIGLDEAYDKGLRAATRT